MHVADLVVHLDKLGYPQCIISFHKDSLIPRHIPVYFYPYHKFYPNKTSTKDMRELSAFLDSVMAKEDPHIFHGHFLIYCCVALYMLCEKYGLPTFLSPWSLRALANDATLHGRIQRCIDLSDYFLTDKISMFNAFSSVYSSLTIDMYKQFRLPLSLSSYHILEPKDLSIPKILSARAMQSNYHQDLLIRALPALFSKYPQAQVTLIIGQHAPQGKPYFDQMKELAKNLGVLNKCTWIAHGLSQAEFSDIIKSNNIVYSVADDPGCSQTTIQAAYSGAVTLVKHNAMEDGILDHGVNTLRMDLTEESVRNTLLYAVDNLSILQPQFALNNRKLQAHDTEFTLPVLYNNYNKVHSVTEFCKICSSPVTVTKISGHDFVCCETCTVRYHYPIPTDKFLKRWYSAGETAKKWGGNLLKAIDANHKQNVTNFACYYDMTKEARGLIKTGKVLDIGCYSGCFLSQFAKDGYECLGIDVNSGFVEYGRQRFDVNLQCGDLKSFNFPSEHFDFVTFHQLLEHLQDPIGFFEEATRILKPNGYLQLSVPDAECNFKVSYPEHIYHFTSKTISTLFDKFKLSGIIEKRSEQLSILALGRKIQ